MAVNVKGPYGHFYVKEKKEIKRDKIVQASGPRLEKRVVRTRQLLEIVEEWGGKCWVNGKPPTVNCAEKRKLCTALFFRCEFATFTTSEIC